MALKLFKSSIKNQYFPLLHVKFDSFHLISISNIYYRCKYSNLKYLHIISLIV